MGLLIYLAVVATIIVVALIRAYAELDEDFLREWARAHGLEVTPGNRPMVGRYLRNARLLRTWGALAGLSLPVLAQAAFGSSNNVPPVWIFGGYLLGALVAELSLVRPRPASLRSASLVPRALAAYLPKKLRLTQQVLGLAISASSLVLAVVPFDDHAWARPGRWWLLLGALGGVALAIGLEQLQRWLLRRPQPFTEPSLVAADDAIRAQSVHSVSGSGIAMELMWLSTVSFSLAQSDIQLLRWTMWIPGFLGLPAAFLACQYYGHRAWRVRRPVAGAAERPAPA